jgi:hypothetical protein
MRNPRGPSQIFDYTSKLLTGVFSLWVLTTNIMLMLGKCPLGSPDPSKDGRGRTWMVLSVSEITDYMNGTDAESDEFYWRKS